MCNRYDVCHLPSKSYFCCSVITTLNANTVHIKEAFCLGESVDFKLAGMIIVRSISLLNFLFNGVASWGGGVGGGGGGGRSWGFKQSAPFGHMPYYYKILLDTP